MLIKIWVKNNFLTIFNEVYKIANLLQREMTRSVEPNIHRGDRLTHQVYKTLKNLQCKEVSKSPIVCLSNDSGYWKTWNKCTNFKLQTSNLTNIWYIYKLKTCSYLFPRIGDTSSSYGSHPVHGVISIFPASLLLITLSLKLNHQILEC